MTLKTYLAKTLSIIIITVTLAVLVCVVCFLMLMPFEYAKRRSPWGLLIYLAYILLWPIIYKLGDRLSDWLLSLTERMTKWSTNSILKSNQETTYYTKSLDSPNDTPSAE